MFNSNSSLLLPHPNPNTNPRRYFFVKKLKWNIIYIDTVLYKEILFFILIYSTTTLYYYKGTVWTTRERERIIIELKKKSFFFFGGVVVVCVILNFSSQCFPKDKRPVVCAQLPSRGALAFAAYSCGSYSPGNSPKHKRKCIDCLLL